MDAVITYVNGLDPMWQKEYAAVAHQPVLHKRYRDWGFLPYLLRGIEQNMPFVENVYLVVSSESQVPIWVNRKRLHVVFHKDIIPTEFLPTFNSTTIELFLHRIPNLSEEFIYFNDDIYPILPLHAKNFFQEGKIVMHFAKHWLALDMYKKQTRQADRMARMSVGRSQGCLDRYVRPQHTCTPMLTSANKIVFAKVGEELCKWITPLRNNMNVNQYVFTDYHYYTSNYISQRISTQHCSMAVYSAKAIAQHILHPQKALLCINDVSMCEAKAQEMHTILHAAFLQRFPLKSHFEK